MCWGVEGILVLIMGCNVYDEVTSGLGRITEEILRGGRVASRDGDEIGEEYVRIRRSSSSGLCARES